MSPGGSDVWVTAAAAAAEEYVVDVVVFRLVLLLMDRLLGLTASPIVAVLIGLVIGLLEVWAICCWTRVNDDDEGEEKEAVGDFAAAAACRGEQGVGGGCCIFPIIYIKRLEF